MPCLITVFTLLQVLFEAGFVSITHDDSVLNKTFEAARKAFKEVRKVHG